MKRILAIILAILLGLSLVGCATSAQRQLKRNVERLSAQCPIRITDDVRIDSVWFTGRKTVHVSFAMENIPEDSTYDIFSEQFKPSLLNFLKTDIPDELERLRKANITIAISFYHKNSNPIRTITIEPKDYK